MKIRGLKITLNDNDFTEILENFFTDVVRDSRVKFERNYNYCIGDPKRELADKKDSESISQYIELSKKIDSIVKDIFDDKNFVGNKLEEYLDFVRINFNDYVDSLSLNDTTKNYLKENIEITPINRISLEWQNDEVVYYIFSQYKTLTF